MGARADRQDPTIRNSGGFCATHRWCLNYLRLLFPLMNSAFGREFVTDKMINAGTEYGARWLMEILFELASHFSNFAQVRENKYLTHEYLENQSEGLPC